MKPTTLSIFLFCLQYFTQAQCSDCYSLEEALKDPERVVSLHLSNKGYTSVPESIGLFSQLRELDLSQNLISEFRLPNTLQTLDKLDLSANFPDPAQIQLIGYYCPNLTTLNLANCHLSFIPSGFVGLTDLKHLNLSGNGLQFLPEDIRFLTTLQTLNMNNNALKTTDSNLGYFWQLQSLSISGNPELNMTDVLQSLQMNTRLKHLEFSNSKWSHATDKIVLSLPLEKVVIDHVQKQLPKGISSHTTIRSLHIRSSATSSGLSDHLKQLSSLKELIFDRSTIPADLGKLDQLERLVLKQVSTANITAIGKWTFLKELDITETDFDTAVVRMLSGLLPDTRIITTYQEVIPEVQNNSQPSLTVLPFTGTSIDSEVASVVKLSNLSFTIPTGAFLTANSTVYTGKVNFEVKFYDDAILMALEGAPMVYNDNGRKQLFSSNGMLEVKATGNNGEILRANPENPIIVTMTNLQPDEPTGLYVHDTLSNNWNPIVTPPVTISPKPFFAPITDSLNGIDFRNYVNFQTQERLYEVRFTKKRLDASGFILESFSPRRKKRISSESLYVYPAQHEGKLICSGEWELDTLMTPELAQLMRTISRSYSINRKRLRQGKLNFITEPRVIRDVHIRPDLLHDHYRLTFQFKDSSINLPVYLSSKSNNGSLNAHRKFQQKLKNAIKKDRKEADMMDRKKDRIVNNFIQNNRTLLFQMVINDGIIEEKTQEMLQFALPNFGLINCDFFMRQPIVRNLALDKRVKDQNGEEYETPDIIRISFPENKTYIGANSDNIPVIDNDLSIVILELPADKLGVVTLDVASGSKQETIRTIVKTGKTAEEIRNFILEE